MSKEITSDEEWLDDFIEENPDFHLKVSAINTDELRDVLKGMEGDDEKEEKEI